MPHFLCKLLPPRKTFAVDMTAQEREAMLACVRFADLKKLDVTGRAAPMEIAIGADGTWHYFWTARPQNARG